MRFRYPFLCGVWILCVANALNGDDMFAIETYKRCQTGIYTRVVDFLGGGIVLAYNNCASTTSTFAAATISLRVVSLVSATMANSILLRWRCKGKS